LYGIALLLDGFLDANINISLKGKVRGVVFFINHVIAKEMQMLEPDVTTSEVVLMYVGIFVFLFGLAFVLMKKHS
jgi:hypothetical protein